MKIFMICLAATIFLSSCAPEATTSQVQTQVQSQTSMVKSSESADIVLSEKEIVLPEEMTMNYKMAFDGSSIKLFAKNSANEVMRYDVHSDQNQLESADWTESYNSGFDKSGFLVDVIEQDNTAYLHVRSTSEDEVSNHIYQFEKDRFIEVTPKGLKASFEEAFITASGDIILVFDSEAGYSIVQYDGNSGEPKHEYEIDFTTDNILSIAARNNDLAVLTKEEGNQYIHIYDTETGKIKREAPVKYKTDEGIKRSENNVELFIKDNGDIFFCSNDGIFLLPPEQDEIKTVLEGSTVSLMTPSIEVIAFAESQDNFYVLCRQKQQESNQVRLFQYAYAEKQADSAKVELIVDTLRDNELIREAIPLMQRESGDVSIRINTLLDKSTGMTPSDAIRQINTELLAGAGADLYILDGLPLQSYIEKGALLDIGSAVLPLVENGELRENLIAPFVDGNSVYAVPTRFSIPVFTGAQEVLQSMSSLDSLSGWVQQHPDILIDSKMDWKSLMYRFYPTSLSTWLTETGELDKSGFSQFLLAVKQISAVHENEANTAPQISDPLEMLANREAHTIYMKVNDLAELNAARHIVEQNGAVWDWVAAPGIAEDGSSLLYEPTNMIGVNKNSRHPDEAKQLLNILFSDALQSYSSMKRLGLPVRGETLKNLLYASGDQANGSFHLMNGATIDVAGWFSESVSEKFDDYCRSLNAPYVHDSSLYNIVVGSCEDYFADNKSLDETVDAVFSQIETYVAE